MTIRSEELDAMRAGLQSVCRALGLDDEVIAFSAAERMFVITGTGVSVRAAALPQGSEGWIISERYQVADPAVGHYDRQEHKGSFRAGEEFACAKAAGLAVASQRIDAAIDAAG